MQWHRLMPPVQGHHQPPLARTHIQLSPRTILRPRRSPSPSQYLHWPCRLSLTAWVMAAAMVGLCHQPHRLPCTPVTDPHGCARWLATEPSPTTKKKPTGTQRAGRLTLTTLGQMNSRAKHLRLPLMPRPTVVHQLLPPQASSVAFGVGESERLTKLYHHPPRPGMLVLVLLPLLALLLLVLLLLPVLPDTPTRQSLATFALVAWLEPRTLCPSPPTPWRTLAQQLLRPSPHPHLAPRRDAALSPTSVLEARRALVPQLPSSGAARRESRLWVVP